jgi:3-deoxy-D-manno-octulosonic-acid transferase
MYFLYSLAIVCYGMLVAPRLLYDAVRHRKYVGTLKERWGRLPAAINPQGVPSIWIHAVSVGEALATRALIPALRVRYPDHPLWLSTTTQTGRAVATGLDGVDGLFYFPFDLPSIVARVLDRVRPELFVMVDTEIWPNLLHHCELRGVKTTLVNGRISDRSYPRYRLVRRFFRRVLAGVDRCCVQSEESGRRLIDLGAPPTRVTVTGNLKFDALSMTDSRSPLVRDGVLRAFRVATGRTVVMAASTHAGEEMPVLEAFGHIRRRDPTALLVVAPRHPERSGEVTALAVGHGLEVVRRSELPVDGEPRAAVVVLDTVGELATLFQIATVVFLGGSLVPAGGHNVLEPAAWGKPVVFGPHMENFAEIAELFLANRAACQIRSADALEPALSALVRDPVRRAALGAAARALVDANRGATDRSLTVLAALLPPAGETAAGVVIPFR